MKNFHIFAPIRRVDDDQRMVEGYAYVNASVPGEGGVRLLRSAMEAASADYLKWSNVREMHQPSAVGVADGVQWDENGAFIRAKIVDDAAWKKVREGVYKGFSVGVRPGVMRGVDIETCDWIETSLVDRPKDPDARITLFRVDTDKTPAPAPESALTPGPESAPPDDPADLVTRAVAGIRVHLAELVRLDRLDAIPEDLPVRLAPAEPDPGLLERLERSSAELAEARQAIAAAEERVQRLEQLPASQPPVRYPAALERTFQANEGATPPEDYDARIKALMEQAAAEPSSLKRVEMAAEINLLRQRASTAARS